MRNKYKAQRVTHDGYSFASRLESSVFTLLKARENAGEIEILQVQDHIYLTEARILYMPDFKCLDIASQKPFWVEAKGLDTPSWNIKKKLWMFYGPGLLQIYKGTHLRPFLKEVLAPKNM